MEISITLTEEEYAAFIEAMHEAGYNDVRAFAYATIMQNTYETLAKR